MFMQHRNALSSKLDEEFARPVESIMRCEDFKSNFARRLSNRYTSRTPASGKDASLKLRPLKTNAAEEIADNVPERIEPCSQLSKTNDMEQNGEIVKHPDKSTSMKTDIRCTEVIALNMEVETLKWQLAQTEANRQMHIALLKQIVTFLNRVKEHIECQKNDSDARKEMPVKVLPRSFNSADLPRTRSVLHVNKNPEYSISPAKKISSKKISKSISNVNGYRDCTGVWNKSKISLTSESESSKKMTEEISRLITLANTVLSTKLPDLACTCNNNICESSTPKEDDNSFKEEPQDENKTNTTFKLIEENTSNALILNTICDSADAYNGITNKFIEAKDRTLNDFIVSPSPLTCGLENDFAGVKMKEKYHESPSSMQNGVGFSTEKTPKATIDKTNDYNRASNFVEDESGFSSMNSFQEIGIPIISIIPPSPCKEIGYIEEIPDILDETEKWKTDTMELEQRVKVFWV